ncbi:hypothetical protein [Serratia quinivorans]
MTMCVMWKGDKGNIHVATDSRLSFGEKRLDHCVKISRLSSLLHEPGDYLDTDKKLVDSRDITIAFCGGFTNAYIVKESLSEILNKLVILYNKQVVSFKDIVDVAFIIYKETSCAMFSTLMDDVYGCLFYIIGYCPLDEEMQAYKFEFKLNAVSCAYDFISSKLFENCNFEISGSGLKFLQSQGSIIDIVNHSYLKNKFNPLLDVLNDVINNELCVSVGGAIQYIECTPIGSTLFGHLQIDGQKVKYMKAGVDLNELNNDFEPLGLFVEPDVISGEDNI